MRLVNGAELLAALAGAARIASEDEASALDPAARMETAGPILRDALAQWSTPNAFHRGDILRPVKHGSWKEGLGHVIVLRTTEYEEMVTDNHHTVIPYNMRVLSVTSDGKVYEIKVHSRDFELVERVT